MNLLNLPALGVGEERESGSQAGPLPPKNLHPHQSQPMARTPLRTTPYPPKRMYRMYLTPAILPLVGSPSTVSYVPGHVKYMWPADPWMGSLRRATKWQAGIPYLRSLG